MFQEELYLCFSLLNSKSVSDVKVTGSSSSIDDLQRLKSSVTVSDRFMAVSCPGASH